jgi:hypothetical protein
MKTFTSLSDLDRLSDDDPAKPVVQQLLEWLTAPGEFPDHPYDPDDHGYIALVEPGDADRELDDIDMPRLTDILNEFDRVTPSDRRRQGLSLPGSLFYCGILSVLGAQSRDTIVSGSVSGSPEASGAVPSVPPTHSRQC